MKTTSKTESAIDLPIETHRENIKREGEDLAKALHSSTSIAAFTENAAVAEREAKEHLAIQEAARAASAQIQADWNKLIAELARLKERLAAARCLLKSSEELYH